MREEYGTRGRGRRRWVGYREGGKGKGVCRSGRGAGVWAEGEGEEEAGVMHREKKREEGYARG